MLPKSKRIPRKSFPEIIKTGKIFNSNHFTLRKSSSKELRVAVSVSKKVSKKAVIRNRTRRRVYSSMRKLLPFLEFGLYLIIAKVGADKLKGELLESELKKLFRI